MDLLKKMQEIATAKFCEDVLKKSENDDSIKVSDVVLRPATQIGDNYTSDMFRVTVEYSCSSRIETEKKSIIIKVEPIREGIHQLMVSKSSLFSTEIAMLSDALEKMNDILGATKNRLNARLLFYKKNPSMIVVEDLMPLGFHMADREAGLDLDHCVLAIRNLARFHGSSVALCEKDDSYKKKFNCGLISRRQCDEIKMFFTEGVKILAKESATWPELDQKYSEKLTKIQEEIFDRSCDATDVDEDEFNVINHGDFWVNNSLFKYDDSGRPIQHIFVDFQLCSYGSPAIDLLYFLNTSLSEENLLQHEEFLLKEYLSNLSITMARAGCRTIAPTLDELKETMLKRHGSAMLASFVILPNLVADKAECRSISEMVGSDGSFVNPTYKGKLFRKIMCRRLPIYDKMGLLD